MQKVVVLEAIDWGIYTNQVSAKHEFDIVRGMVVGFLVSEDNEKIVLAPQWFYDGDTRCTLVVPKCTITNRTDLELEPTEEAKQDDTKSPLLPSKK